MPPDPETEQPRQSASGTPDGTDSPATTETIAEASSSPSSRESEVEEAYNYWQKDWQKPPSPPDDDDSGLEDGEPPDLRKMSFLDHLEELRHRLFYCLISVVVGFLVCWTFADDIYAGLATPLTGTLRELGLDDHLVYTNPVAPFQLYVHMAFMGSLFVAAPFILYQVWRFIAPGLYPHERRYAAPFVFLCSGLFMAGGAFAYYVAFPAALRFLLTFGGQFRPMITVNEYFSLATTIILGMALVFELPILLLFLTLLRVMTPRFLLRNFRYAVLLIFILAAAITPTPDVPTMMLFAMPLIGLYLFGVGLSYIVLRMRARRREA
ncbi:MAG: Sec-independent protein translocase protein TatC [Acidobacteria bacterium]|nr:Sec-independent protein translocase protein TatC [Acidobacteriota bacterium]